MLGRRDDPSSRALREELNRRREETLAELRLIEDPPSPIYDPENSRAQI